jgi:CheY-like chemotaxis protein
MTANTSVKRAKVVILEDEPQVAKRLESKLNELGNIEPQVVSDMQAFAKVIEADRFFAASIDWELHSVYKGPEALEMLEAFQPDAATVVNTRHEVEDEAKRLKVDAFLTKQRNLNLYAEVMDRAVRLSYARLIAKSLQFLEVRGLPDLSPGGIEKITDAAETVIHDKGRSAVLDAKLADRPDDRIDALTDLLKDRGWWEHFDVIKYTALSQPEKLRTLIACAQITNDDLAAILDISPQVAEKLNAGETSKVFDSEELTERYDVLLSILGFFLRLSDYDPELVPFLWREKQTYENCGSLARPPWDKMGMSDYLKKYGPKGMSKSLTWIRRY